MATMARVLVACRRLLVIAGVKVSVTSARNDCAAGAKHYQCCWLLSRMWPMERNWLKSKSNCCWFAG
eukprot:7605633-Lingulodinium_polyedra.AAC.1